MGSGNCLSSSRKSSPSSILLMDGCVLLLTFCDTGRAIGVASMRVSSSAALAGKPWFSNSIDPGSSTGVGGSEIDRGRPGRGLYIEAVWGCSSTHGAGERSKSLKTACRLVAALVSAKLYDADRGLKQNCLLSDVMILMSDGRRRLDFGVSYSSVLANGVAPQHAACFTMHDALCRTLACWARSAQPRRHAMPAHHDLRS